MSKPKILTIVGPTASGKTSLSIHLAQQFGGEVVSADSRQVYRGLDLGTGKVTKEEMQGVSHHLLDVADPRERYTVADFVRDGRTAISEILARQNLPIIAGGTFFYVDALLGKISTPEVEPNEVLRTHLETLSTDALFELLRENDPERAETIDKNNRRRLIRALEIVEAIGTVPVIEQDEPYINLTLGILISKEKLLKNIHTRLMRRIDLGMIDEVRNLHGDGVTYERLEDLGLEYRYIAEYLQEKISKEEMMQLIETKSWQYAKRQITWLKRNANIAWVNPNELGEIENIVDRFLISNS